jgi:sugar phosphate isomerase/epimerase
MELSTLELTPEEKSVYDYLKEHGKSTQLEIARGCPNLGSHEIHEGYEVKASTLRKVRQLIRDMRINKGIYILSDTKGYWIMQNRDEIHSYLMGMEQKAKASAKGFMVTYHAMRKNFGVNSDYFNKQQTLFD